MDALELKNLVETQRKIKLLKNNIVKVNGEIERIESNIKNDNAMGFSMELRTHRDTNRQQYSLYCELPSLLGLPNIVRALKDSVSATKGYLHHLEKEFNRR